MKNVTTGTFSGQEHPPCALGVFQYHGSTLCKCGEHAAAQEGQGRRFDVLPRRPCAHGSTGCSASNHNGGTARDRRPAVGGARITLPLAKATLPATGLRNGFICVVQCFAHVHHTMHLAGQHALLERSAPYDHTLYLLVEGGLLCHTWCGSTEADRFLFDDRPSAVCWV